jgi:hypothetical protein
VLLVGFVLTACCTLGNLLVRWMRWHFLTRRFALFFRTRESIKLYFATLPLLAVPAFLGELLRPWTISGRDPRARWVVLQVWFLERAMDVSVVALWWLIGLQAWRSALSVGLVSWVVVGVVLTYFERRRGNPRPRRDAAVFAATVYGGSALAWLLPSAALFGVLWMLSAPSTVFGVLEAFSAGTLLGGLTGLPLGTGVTGAQTVERLVAAGSSSEFATWAVLVLRLGTA